MLECEQPPLVRAAERAVPAEAARGDDTVAGDEHGEAVLRAEGACCARGTGPAGERRELTVRDDFAARDRAKDVGKRATEGRELAQVEVDI
jgi:hypothetical protein